MMRSDEVIVQPHRRKLNLERVHHLQQTMRQHDAAGSLGAAVAYRPSVGWVLLGGEHRWKAAVAPGSRREVMILTSWMDLVAWMAVDMTDGRRLPWDPVAAVYFYEKASATLKPTRHERALDDVAEFTGIHRGILDGVRYAMSLLADPDEEQDVKEFVQTLLDDLERGGDGGHSVRDKVNRYKAHKAAQERPQQSAATQRKALESIAQLEGTLDALLQMSAPNPDIPREELELYAARLGKLGPVISKIKKNLRRGASE